MSFRARFFTLLLIASVFWLQASASEVPQDKLAPASPFQSRQHRNPLNALKDPTLKAFIRDMLLENYGGNTSLSLEGLNIPQTVNNVLDALESFDGDSVQAARFINQSIFDFTGPASNFRRLEKVLVEKAVGAWGKTEKAYARSFFLGPRVYDCGCGYGDFLKELEQQYPGKFPQRLGSDIYDYVVNDGSFTFVKQEADRIPVNAIGKGSVNSSQLSCVLHHTYLDDRNPSDPQTRDKIVMFLRDHWAVLAQGGRLIVYEDSYPAYPAHPSSHLIRGPPPDIAQAQQPELTKRFLALTPEQKYKYLVWNDWYWNMLYSGLYDMQMPYRYYSMEEWIGIFHEAGFHVREAQYWGFTKNRIHGASTAFFVLEKSPDAFRGIFPSPDIPGAGALESSL